jgi:stage V sporulation protein G
MLTEATMEVTEVKVFPVNEEKLKAYATITFDNCFIVRDLKVIHGQSGLFVAMPSKKRKDGTYKDTAHPINSETRAMIESKVLDEYDRELRRAGQSPAATPRPIPAGPVQEGAEKSPATTPPGEV